MLSVVQNMFQLIHIVSQKDNRYAKSSNSFQHLSGIAAYAQAKLYQISSKRYYHVPPLAANIWFNQYNQYIIYLFTIAKVCTLTSGSIYTALSKGIHSRKTHWNNHINIILFYKIHIMFIMLILFSMKYYFLVITLLVFTSKCPYMFKQT